MNRKVVFRYCYISSVLVRNSFNSPSDNRERHFFKVIITQAASFPDKYTIESMVYCAISQILSTLVGYEE